MQTPSKDSPCLQTSWAWHRPGVGLEWGCVYSFLLPQVFFSWLIRNWEQLFKDCTSYKGDYHHVHSLSMPCWSWFPQVGTGAMCIPCPGCSTQLNLNLNLKRIKINRICQNQHGEKGQCKGAFAFTPWSSYNPFFAVPCLIPLCFVQIALTLSFLFSVFLFIFYSESEMHC